MDPYHIITLIKEVSPPSTNIQNEEPISSPNHHQQHLVTPGQTISQDPQFMKGHGVYIDRDSNDFVSCLGGRVNTVNKLITVYPLRTRYIGEIGDVIVGRVTELGYRRWRVDIYGYQDAVLQLSALNLPGGVQRRKTEDDENDMRQYLREGDLVVAEVQAKRSGECIQLHTRSNKYRKLRNGLLVCIPPSLIQRCKSHFVTLPNGVHVILGMNGYIWVQLGTTSNNDLVVNSATILSTSDQQPTVDVLYASKNDCVSKEMRNEICRVRNCIQILVKHDLPVSDTLLVYAYEASLSHTSVVDLLQANVMHDIAEQARLVYQLSLQ